MYLTGFADEAADDLAGQIRATKELGWKHIEIRGVDGVNFHDLDEAAFDRACGQLAEAGVEVNCFGSTIANWSKSVDDDFAGTLATVERTIKRMHRLGTKLVRIMSYKVLTDADGKALADQMEAERFRRLAEICRRFSGAGLTPVHENCFNYGGMSWEHSLRMLDNVPGMKLVFDTGNPPVIPDFSKPEPRPMQSSWDFYDRVREHIAYVHIKDVCWNPETREETFVFPGEGEGDVVRIVRDLSARGYDGGFSMEPHMLVVYHHGGTGGDAEARLRNYVEYGRRFEKILAQK